MEDSHFKPCYDRRELKSYEDLTFGPILGKNEFDYVYRPGDDSYLLLDALRFEQDNIIKQQPSNIIEIG